MDRNTVAIIDDGPNRINLAVQSLAFPAGDPSEWYHTLDRAMSAVIAEAFRLGKEAR